MNATPIVSVVMCCYNSERYLRESIDSILNQTFTDFEFVIWNDGSTDRTEEIIRSYSDTRIRYFSEKNQGLGKALHDACEKVTGKYIVRMDDDDISLPNRLQVEYSFMEKHKDCVLASSAVYYIDESGEIFGFSAPALTDGVLKKTFSFVHPGVIFRREIYLQTIGYQNLRTAQDKVLWQMFSPLGKFRNINQILLKYRIQSNSIGRKQRIPELTNCCEQIRCRLVEEGRQGYLCSELIELHNHIFCLNSQLSKNLPAVKDQRNGLYSKVCNMLCLFMKKECASKLLSCCITIYRTIK